MVLCVTCRIHSEKRNIFAISQLYHDVDDISILIFQFYFYLHFSFMDGSGVCIVYTVEENLIQKRSYFA